MKAAAIALAVVAALLALALYQRGASATQTLEAVVKDQQSLSNQVAEFRTRLTLAQVTASQTTSNLQRNLGQRTGDLTVISNRLVQTHLLLQASQKESRAAQDQLQSRIARVALLEQENGELRDRMSHPAETANTTREREMMRRELADAAREKDALQARLGAMQVEKESAQAQLFDVEFLERQLKDAAVAADIRRRMASARAGAAPDPRMKLELQPDGTVRYAAPAARGQ